MITMTPATNVIAGDVLSTDGYVVSTVVLLPKSQRVFIQARLGDDIKTDTVPFDTLLPIYTKETTVTNTDPVAAAIHRERAERHWANVLRLDKLGLTQAASDAERAAKDEDDIAYILETGKQPRSLGA
jgi:hypothetical protein